ncbi:HK97-gp10 family putative phage morphogenesis protein [Virgibacillus sp. W0430]|uniref:HK97-gp10 family putative phage morphogenesis protein n=1 Tax=Virgibacillus sp. W0430 TaxID=3391580 RepID=UPI003F4560C1
MKFDFEGMDELVTRLSNMEQGVETAKNEALLEGAKVMQKATKERAPKMTRNLEMNIEISDVEGDEVEVYVDQQGHAYYGYMLEYGTVKMRAQPFMGPAFNQNITKIQNAMAYKIRQRLMAL